MSHEATGDRSEHTVSVRTMDVVVAILFMVAGAVVMWDALRVGASWGADGPEAGYFPFYVGLLMFLASGATAVTSVVTKTPDLSTFVERGQLSMVLKVLVPTAIYVALIPFIGLYVASAIFIAFFMAWIGKYGPVTIVPIAIGVPVFLFVLFEIWFLVPLPKGPVENMLGY
jgi:putative tricarboxylic transport membrane protein